MCTRLSMGKSGAFLRRPPLHLVEVPRLMGLIVDDVPCPRAPFFFSSIQLNHNTVSVPHTDKHNLGLSLIIGLGDYQQGLFQATGCEPMNIRNQALWLDGRGLHWSTTFTGRSRFSVVLFVHAGLSSLPPSDVSLLSSYGGFAPQTGLPCSARRRCHRSGWAGAPYPPPLLAHGFGTRRRLSTNSLLPTRMSRPFLSI